MVNITEYPYTSYLPTLPTTMSALAKSIAESAAMRDAIEAVVNDHVEMLIAHLVNQGIDRDQIEAALDTYGGEGAPAKKQKKFPLTKKNKAKIVDGGAPAAAADKAKPTITKPTIMTDYSAKAHALFGDFRSGDLATFKDSVLTAKGEDKLPGLKANSRLAYGFGWVFSSAEDKIDELRAKLDEYNIEYDEISRADYESANAPAKKEKKKAAPAAAKKTLKKEAPAPAAKKGKKAPPAKKGKKAVVTKMQCKKNKWGNIEEKNTGLIVLPKVDVGEEKVNIVVGYQDDQTKEKGLDSVLPLDEACEGVCKENNWTYLTHELADQIRENDEELADQLDVILAAGEEDDEAAEEEEGDEVDSDDEKEEEEGDEVDSDDEKEEEDDEVDSDDEEE